MSEKPILFSGLMVRAILEGRKTQTRRPVKGSPINMIRLIGADDKPTGEFGFCSEYERVMDRRVKCPYGESGDRLWVRETWKPHIQTSVHTPAIYRADYANDKLAESIGKWKPSIFMPRWASRITLEVTDVRVQRLQDISEEDAKAEGASIDCLSLKARYRFEHMKPWPEFNRPIFSLLWDDINGDGSWEANPWVYALSFEVLETARKAAWPLAERK